MTPSHSRPNILFIQSDSMDGRAMGCMNHPAAYTPHMDRLAERGVLFTNTYCNSPQCCPSRASMWSGRYVHEVEAWNNYKGLSPDDPTWRTHLDNAGYLTKTIGKTDYVSGSHSLGNRVTAWTAPADIRVPGRVSRPQAQLVQEGGREAHTGDWQSVAQSLAWLEDRQGTSQPFMLYLGLNLPHPPFTTTSSWLDLIDEDDVRLPPFDEDMHPVMDFMRVRKGCIGDFTDAEILAMRRTYYAMVAELDAMVGRVLDKVDELGLADSTYVIYLSDHGEMAMEHRQHLKNSFYEPSARVPMIIAGPNVVSRTTVDDLVSLINVPPTLLDMAGIEPPADFTGYSLMPELVGSREADRPDVVFSEYHSNFQNTSSFMVRRGSWKYIAYDGYEPQLFNLEEDPWEMDNLASSHRDMAEEMDAELRDIVDYPAVAEQVRAYNKASFLNWRETVDARAYEETMEMCFRGWGPALKRKLAAWLEADA